MADIVKRLREEAEDWRADDGAVAPPGNTAKLLDDTIVEIERLRAVLTEHVVLAEYPYSGDASEPSGYICQICNDKGDDPDDIIHKGDCPLYDAEKDATEAGTVD